MTDAELVFECVLEAPPEKVWRALTVPEYLERWLQPPPDLDLEVIAAEENRSLSYRWRESAAADAPPIGDSVVTFELEPDGEGGTWFRLTHAPLRLPAAANANAPLPVATMLAA